MTRTILITNDDGIHSDGLLRLARSAVRYGEVWVIAPDTQRSALSHSITLDQPLEIRPAAFGTEGVHAFSCSGTPADCVRLAVKGVMPVLPDVVLSGINYGYNSATDIQYSATVGAAMEASFLGYRAIALSEQDVPCHEVTDAYLETVLDELIDADPGPDQVWNVNFPGCCLDKCSGILRDRRVSGDIVYEDSYDPVEIRQDGSIRYVVSGCMRDEAEEGTDFHALLLQAVSIGKVRNIC